MFFDEENDDYFEEEYLWQPDSWNENGEIFNEGPDLEDKEND